MIYIEENSFEKQVELFNLFINRPYYLVFWIYPESNIDDFLGHTLYKENDFSDLSVTKYNDEAIVRRTKRFEFCSYWIDFILENKDFIISNCDNFSLYEENETEWFCCTIGHEGMCLINDDNIINKLHENAIAASLTPPSWW